MTPAHMVWLQYNAKDYYTDSMEAGCLDSTKIALQKWLKFAAKQAANFTPPPPPEPSPLRLVPTAVIEPATTAAAPCEETSPHGPAKHISPSQTTLLPHAGPALHERPPAVATVEASEAQHEVERAQAQQIYHEVLHDLAMAQTARMAHRDERRLEQAGSSLRGGAGKKAKPARSLAELKMSRGIAVASNSMVRDVKVPQPPPLEPPCPHP